MTTQETKPALYCGTYAKYNNGSIAGKWLELENYGSAEEFLQACAELHKDESDPEYMFQDFEGFPKELYGESLSLVDLEKIYGYLALDENDRDIVAEYANATGYSFDDFDFDQATESYYTTLESGNHERELGEYVIDEGLFGVEIPEALQSYIDYEAIGRDWLMDMSVSDNGYVFTSY